MKKLLVCILILLLLCGCTRGVESCPAAEAPTPEGSEPVEESAPEEEGAPLAPMEGHYEAPEEPVIEETNIIRKEPCSLQIANGSRIGEVLGGTCSWWYDNGDGTATGIEACGMHPLEMKKHMPVLIMDGTEAELLVDAEAPDKVTIRGWSVSQWGSYEAEAEEIPVDGLQFELKNEGFIYEVALTWDRFDKWGGTAYYVFCAAPLGVELHAEAVTDKGMTLVCTQSGGNPMGELQTGHAFRLEKRDENGVWYEVESYAVEPELEIDWAWNEEALIIPENDTVRWEIDWQWLYGSQPDGIYRLGKEIVDFRDTGDYDTYMVWSDNFAIAWVDE